MLSREYVQIAHVFRSVAGGRVPDWSREEVEQVEQLIQAAKTMLCSDMEEHNRRVRAAATPWEAQARFRTAKQFAAESYAPRMAMLEEIVDAVIARRDALNDCSSYEGAA
jgi:hypothetical protein